MARDEGLPASRALEEKTVGHWFGTQPREVVITLAARTALRALPLIAAELDQRGFKEWVRRGFEVLPFFRIAHATWTFLRTPNDSTSAAVRAALQPISVNSIAGSAVTLAAAATLSRSRDSIAEFAARAIGAAVRADSAIADITLAELMLFDRGSSYTARAEVASELASTDLWQGEMAHAIANAWALLKSRMLLAGDDWHVWVNWYEDRLAGRPSLGEAFDIAVATLPDELWKRGPKAVNAEIGRLIEVHTPPQPIPAQGAGPQFGLSTAYRIGPAAASDIDAAGNNLGRLRQQLPLVREAADDLAGRLNPNAFTEIARNLIAYRAAIEGEPETLPGAWSSAAGSGSIMRLPPRVARSRIVCSRRSKTRHAKRSTRC